MPARTDRTLLLSLPRDARSAGVARHAVTAIAAAGGEVRDTAELLVTEVVSNAVRHGRGSCVLLAAASGRDGLSIAVFDQGPDLDRGPEPCRRLGEAVEPAESGRGLQLVADLARAWGSYPVGDAGKWVWFTLDADGCFSSRPVSQSFSRPVSAPAPVRGADQTCLLPVRCA
ncbi:ATP-binding protein [Streptacidiphilus sp. N1-12]|uniref:ATP-binding protein n=2 Tax=Streptacidiphilus alkalitolerans TaxID=3342712 RepID=A0ABV6WSI8_9ACTN